MTENPGSAEEAADRERQMTGAITIMRNVINGLFNSGFVRPLLLLGAMSTVLQQLTYEYLEREWSTKGRMGFEEAKKATLNLVAMSRSDLDDRIALMNEAITQQELHDVDTTTKH